MQGPQCRPSLTRMALLADFGRQALVELGDVAADGERRTERGTRIAEGGHHGVADGLDHGTVMAANCTRQHGVVLAHPAVSARVADPIVQRARSPDVGKQEGDAANFDLVARPRDRFR